jgi:predicted transcriptional regulator
VEGRCVVSALDFAADLLFFVLAPGVAVAGAMTVAHVLRVRRRRILLGLLREFDDYGLSLWDRAREAGTPLWLGPIYPELRAMEREGLLESREVSRPCGFRKRRYYAVRPQQGGAP